MYPLFIYEFATTLQRVSVATKQYASNVQYLVATTCIQQGTETTTRCLQRTVVSIAAGARVFITGRTNAAIYTGNTQKKSNRYI